VRHNISQERLDLYRATQEARDSEFSARLLAREKHEQDEVDHVHQLAAAGLSRREIAWQLRRHYDTVSRLLAQLPTSHPAYQPLDYFLTPDPPGDTGGLAKNLDSST
jgi:hypothetical protein